MTLTLKIKNRRGLYFKRKSKESTVFKAKIMDNKKQTKIALETFVSCIREFIDMGFRENIPVSQVFSTLIVLLWLLLVFSIMIWLSAVFKKILL